MSIYVWKHCTKMNQHQYSGDLIVVSWLEKLNQGTPECTSKLPFTVCALGFVAPSWSTETWGLNAKPHSTSEQSPGKQSPSLKSGNKEFTRRDVRCGPASQISGEVLYWLTVWWSGSGQKQITVCYSLVPLSSSIPNLRVLALCFDGLINPNAAWNPARCLPGEPSQPLAFAIPVSSPLSFPWIYSPFPGVRAYLILPCHPSKHS